MRVLNERNTDRGASGMQAASKRFLLKKLAGGNGAGS